MKYEEFEKEIMSEIEDTIVKNKTLYESGENDVNKYNTDLMKDTSNWNERISINSEEWFSDVWEELNKAKKILEEHQVAKIEKPSLDIEDNNTFASFDYKMHTFVPLEDISEIDEYFRGSVIKEFMAKKLGLNQAIYLKCEIMKLYKDNIITIEQLKEAHKGSC